MNILLFIIGVLVGLLLGALFYTGCIYTILKKIKEIVDEASAETEEVDKIKLYKEFYNDFFINNDKEIKDNE